MNSYGNSLDKFRMIYKKITHNEYVPIQINNVIMEGQYNKVKSEFFITDNTDNKYTGYTVEIITDDDKFDSLETEWNDLVSQSNVRFYQLFLWLRTWWKHFKKDADLHIILIRFNGKLVGIAPLYIEKFSLLRIYKYKYLRLLGSTIPKKQVNMSFFKYGMSDYLDFIVHPAMEDQVVDIFIDYLKSSHCPFDIAIFNDTPVDSFVKRRLVPGLKKRNYEVRLTISEKCPYIELTGSFEDYLMSLDSNTRHKLRYTDRAVNQKKVFTINNESYGKHVPEAVKNLKRLHQQRWHNQNEPGVFADNRYGSFLFDVCIEAAEDDLLWMYAVYDDSQCIAVNCYFRFKDRIYDYVKAFDDQHPLAKFRPGYAIQLIILKEAIKRHIPVIDLMRGDEHYKMKLANNVNTNWNVSFEDPARINFLKKYYYKLDKLLFNSLQSLKNLIYIFKARWEKEKEHPFKYVWNFTGFLTKKIISRYNVRFNKK
jgi:CelD/BcsL family acetyltransferase involved in cellulose biosynthesis